ncbi:MAG: efflux transporter outer membrane subunit [Ferrovibrio sp.]|uniref:efflux transporter outer membrane subunit n=1 Tax=Ferrovibrio sp. TaxID=1917215 RepID=UPI00262667A8|nr:efflux transporter outer membrane subunit [Ferrovibrio sp.]MCW0234151.1 efflux transporter outer membrane subunit [Ferrovibrio sp.]
MRSPLRLTATAVVALSLGACSMVPDYFKPAVETPKAWDSRQDAADLWPDTQWWTGFGSTELNRLIAEAQANNTDLRVAVARIRQAEAQAKISGADLYPTLGADGGASRTRQGRQTTSSTTGTTSTSSSRSDHTVRNSFSGDLTAGYQVDLFGGNAATADAALTRLESSRYNRETVAITLYADIASTYFQLLSLRDRIRLANETLAAAQGILDLLETQRTNGVITDYEVAQQRSNVATQRATVASLQQTERTTLDALAVLLGRPPQGFVVQGDTLAVLVLPPVTAGLPSELLLRRPDIRKAEADLRAANFDVGAARAARFPSLDLTGRIGTQTSTSSTLFDPGTMIYSIAASLTAPIFQGGRLEGGEELSRAQKDELVETYRASILSAFRDTEDALGATVNTGRQYGFASEAYEQANDAYRIVEARYRAGTVGFLDLLDAQRSLFSANDTVVQAALSRYSANVSLYKALGGGWDGSVLGPTAQTN